MNQTVVILPKLTLAFARPMSDIPNTPGFRLLAVMPSGLALPLRVDVGSNGLHFLRDQRNTHRAPSAFTGWVLDEVK
jgi:hypothetical protein